MDKLNSYWQDYCSGCIHYSYLKRKLASIDERKKHGEKLSVSYSDELETDGTLIYIDMMPYGQIVSTRIGDYPSHKPIHNGRNFPFYGTRIYKFCHWDDREYFIHVNPLYKSKLKECIKDYEHLIEKD